MGYLSDDGTWVTGRQGEERAQLKNAAKTALRHAHRPDRPHEAAAGNASDPTRRAARKFAELAKGEVDPKTISNTLHLDRRELGHDDGDADSTSRLNATLIDGLAETVDDGIEAAHTRDEDEDLQRFDAWLEETHGISGDALEAHLETLDEEHAAAMVDALNNDYEHRPGDDDCGDVGESEFESEFNARLEWLQGTYGLSHEELVAYCEQLGGADAQGLLDQLDAEYEHAAGAGVGSGEAVGGAAEPGASD
ncbi:MAG TPA: hypothetical protein VK506_05005 [Conexibacter sp.]|nr:hypothetical protein [Conexibacter sp.]